MRKRSKGREIGQAKRGKVEVESNQFQVEDVISTKRSELNKSEHNVITSEMVEY